MDTEALGVLLTDAMRWHGSSEPAQSAQGLSVESSIELSLESSLDPDLDLRLCDRHEAATSDPSGAASARRDHTESGHEDLFLRPPCPGDGSAVWQLARDSASLDLNSPYCYLLLCSHFADTSLVAEQNGDIVGFVLAYRPPKRWESIFVWQIAVAASHRGVGLARRLLEALVEQPAVRDVRQLEATVTPSNPASRRLFLRFAERFSAPVREQEGFAAELFPTTSKAHEPEILLRIGPLDRSTTGAPRHRRDGE